MSLFLVAIAYGLIKLRIIEALANTPLARHTEEVFTGYPEAVDPASPLSK